MLIGLEPTPFGLRSQHAFRLHQASNSCHTTSIAVHTIIDMVCTSWRTIHGSLLTTQSVTFLRYLLLKQNISVDL